MRKILTIGMLVALMTTRVTWAVESHPLMPGALAVAPAVEFTRFGFLIYSAQLWAPEGQYRQDSPFVLSLTYARDIGRERLVEASLAEIKKLGHPVEQHPQWQERLADVLTDVKQGDTLTGVFMPGQGADFFYQNNKTGKLDEPLAALFFSIWLDVRTSEPDLRSALIGQKK